MNTPRFLVLESLNATFLLWGVYWGGSVSSVCVVWGSIKEVCVCVCVCLCVCVCARKYVGNFRKSNEKQ